MKSPIALLSCLLDDVQRLEPDVKHLDRDLKTIKARVEHEGYGFLAIALPTLCDALDKGLELGRFTCPPGFKTGRSTLPRLLSGLWCDVFDEKTGLLKENPRMGYLKCLREILRLFKKLPLSGERDEILDRAAKDKFRQCDESIASVEIDTRHSFILAGVCRVVLNQLEGVDYEQITNKHGPGAVVEGFTPNQKWVDVARGMDRSDPSLEDVGPYDLGFVNEDLFPDWGSDSLGRDPARKRADVLLRHNDKSAVLKVHSESITDPKRVCEPIGTGCTLERTGTRAKLISVPKTSTARRTITIEPCLLQFKQQGLNRVLRDEILRCSVLRNSLDLTDQSKSQKLALEGSRTGIWATIDLSSASDLLSQKLVKIVFQDKPCFLQRLIDSRSTHYVDGKITRQLEKYAGMGNATTFPVQSVVFAVVAIAAILDFEGLVPTMGRVRRASRLVRVYGDDITVPSLYSRRVVDWLEHCGLRVNTAKSFMDVKEGYLPTFRESCGVDAYAGVDLTPVYLRALPVTNTPLDPSAIASLVSTSNLLWERCLYKTSAYLVTVCEKSLKKRLPHVPARSSALGLHSRKDMCNPTRWDPLLQRLLYKAPVVVPIERSDSLDGYAALLKFYHVPLLGRGPRHLERTQKRFSTRIAWRWMPAEVQDHVAQ